MQCHILFLAGYVDLCLSGIANYATKIFMKLNQYLVATSQSATAFAKKAGVSTSTLTRIINGDALQPRFTTQHKIISASDNMISYDDLWPASLPQFDRGKK